jgi:hypothetical protein
MPFGEGQTDMSFTYFILESKKWSKFVSRLYILFPTTRPANNENTDVNVS